MRFCKVCGSPTTDDMDVCSLKCRRVIAARKKRSYEARKKKHRRELARNLYCEVCGKKLRHPGKRCAEHRSDRHGSEYWRRRRTPA
jgi:predicted nucleic acid-binding Zn ribbon protein